MIYRDIKGSPLTNAEIDANFREIVPNNYVTPEMFGPIDGINDEIQIQAAINSLPSAGGIVMLSSKTYNLYNSIVIGNGTATTKSTKTNIRLIGSGIGGDEICVVGYGDGTRLHWSGSSGGTMIYLNGPISGAEISNMTLDGNLNASTGIDLFNPQFSNFNNIILCNMAATAANNYTEYAVRLRAVPTSIANQVSRGAISNTFNKLIIRFSSMTYNGMSIGDDVSALNNIGSPANNTIWDCLQNIFTDCTFTANSTDLSYKTAALMLCFTDNSSFFQCLVTHFWNQQTIDNYGVGLRIKPPQPSRYGNSDDIFMAQGFPCEIGFYNTAILRGIEVDNTRVIAGGGVGWSPVNYAGISIHNFGINDGETFPDIDGIWGYTSRGEYYTPRALGYRGAILTANSALTTSSGVASILTFSSVQSNDDYIWSSDDPELFRVVKSGLYLVNLTCNWAANSTGVRKIQLLKASTKTGTYNEIAKSIIAATPTSSTSNNIVWTGYLISGYYLQFKGTQTSGVSLDMETYYEASVIRLR
jgi:hypothetical protein